MFVSKKIGWGLCNQGPFNMGPYNMQNFKLGPFNMGPFDLGAFAQYGHLYAPDLINIGQYELRTVSFT